MQYRLLGNSGVRVSELCLGTMTFGTSACGEAAAHKMIDSYIAAGGNFIDTADVYNNGKSEHVVGNWIAANAAKRSSLVIATKVYFQGTRKDPNRAGLSRKHIMESVSESLSRLQCGYIDLYQIHNWDSQVKPEVWLLTFRDLVRSGRIRMLGISNFTGWQMGKVIELGRKLGVPIVSTQSQYNLLCRGIEFETLHCCDHENIGFIAWSPLKGGWLAGKFKRDTAPPADSRVGAVHAGKNKANQSGPSYEMYNNDKTWALLANMEKIAASHKATVAQVALRWVLQRPAVTCVAIGARNMSQLTDNLGAAVFKLTDAEMKTLSDSSKVFIPYPYEMVWRACRPLHGRLDGDMWDRAGFL